MKNIPQIHFQTPSRDSLRGESINRQNKVDTYFSDLNGNSLISTLNSSKDLFGAISSSNLSQRNSLLSGSKSNRGINAAKKRKGTLKNVDYMDLLWCEVKYYIKNSIKKSPIWMI